jgi:hypothetical protein
MLDAFRLGGLLLSLFMMALVSGCHKTDTPPPSLTIEQLPPALQQAFANAKPGLKGPLEAVVKWLEAKDYSKAYFALQTLSGQPGLTRKQAQVCASGLLTLNDALQQAQSQGDQKAAQTLKVYRENK